MHAQTTYLFSVGLQAAPLLEPARIASASGATRAQ